MAVTSLVPDQNVKEKSLDPASGKGKVLPSKIELTKREKLLRDLGRRDVVYMVFISSVHVLCLFAPATFSWGALGTAYILYLLTGAFGIVLSYHRNLSHRSFKLPKYLEYLFAYFAMQAHQGDPIFWVSTHRHHHKVTDTERDPHSPIEGLFFSHIGWLFNSRKLIEKGASYSNVQDLKSQPYYRFLQKTELFHLYALAMLLYMIGGFPYIVWGMGVRTVWGYHNTFIVNSIGHHYGHEAWNTGDLSKNIWYLSLVSFGDSWHNNHHAFEYSARHGLEWWQIDQTWYMIKLLEYLGLATDVKVPSEKDKQRLSLKKVA